MHVLSCWNGLLEAYYRYNSYFRILQNTIPIRRIFHIITLCFLASCLWAQVPEPYREGIKWGYRLNDQVLIMPQYDTAFPFDRTGRIAMAGIRNTSRTEINPLTGEENYRTDYCFINRHNIRLSLKLPASPDSVSVFPAQQELSLGYLSASSVFKVLYGQKVWLFSKQGKQLSAGFDDIYPTGAESRFFITETYSEWDKEVVRVKGLIDTSGRIIVNCEKKHIRINAEDSVIYACSAIFNRQLSDEVFDYKGSLVYSSKHHIEFAAKDVYIYVLYEPKELFVVAGKTKDLYRIEGQHFYHLKHKKGLIVDGDTWLLVNLQTGKKQRVNKAAFLDLCYIFME